MVTIRKLLLVLLSLTFFVLPEPFGLLQAEGQEKRTLKLIEGAKKEKEVVVWHIDDIDDDIDQLRSEEYTSELQSRGHLVCRLLLEKKNTQVRTPLSVLQYQQS